VSVRLVGRATVNIYTYKAMDRSGQVVEKQQVARDERDLRITLKDGGFTVISVAKSGLGFRKHRNEFTTQFLRHLRQLLSNRLDLMTSLEITERLFARAEERAIVTYIISSIRSGCTLSASLAKIGNCFDLFVIKTIEISEKTSKLTEALDGIIEYMAAKADIGKSVKNAMRYPIVLVCCVVCVMLFWLIAVVPKFAELFVDVGAKLPLITRVIIRVSTALSEHCVSTFMGFVILGITAFMASKSKEVMEKVPRVIPVVSTIKREMYAMNFFYAMGMMIREKIHLMEGLECISSMGHTRKIREIVSLVKGGSNLSNAMGRSGLFNDRELSIIEAGERSGDLWPAFKAGADMLKAGIIHRTQKAVSMLQPLTIVVIGGMLITIICSVIMPIYSNLEFCL
jgi:type II secretory pathway component PulF